MLALSRAPGESIVIGDNIVVQVVWASATKVRLAIEAPKDVRVDRLEVALARSAKSRRREADRGDRDST